MEHNNNSDAENQDDFEVEQIIDRRVNIDGNIEYKVRWKHYGPSEDQWVGFRNLQCPVLVYEFEARQAVREDIAQLRNEIRDLSDQNEVDINRIVDVVNKNSNTLGQMMDMFEKARQSPNPSNAHVDAPDFVETQNIVPIPGSSPGIPLATSIVENASASETSIVENASASETSIVENSSASGTNTTSTHATVPTPTTSLGLHNNPNASSTIVENAGVSSMGFDDGTSGKFAESGNQLTLKTPSGKNPVRCNVCNKVFYKNNNLKSHVLSVHGGRKFQCPEEGCNKLYTSVYRYRTHYKASHKNPAPDPKTTIVHENE